VKVNIQNTVRDCSHGGGMHTLSFPLGTMLAAAKAYP